MALTGTNQLNPDTTMNHELPVFLQELLAAPPRAGAGVHNWLFRVARHLHAHLPGGEIVQLLEARVAGCGRPVPRAEIVKAVQGSLPCMWQPGGNHPGAVATPPPARWPRVNDETRADIVREGYGLADLWERSYPRLEDSETHTEAIIDHLFPGNPLLCCGQSSTAFDTRPREAWRGQLNQLALIVPSPMIAHEGRTQDGRLSKHTLANTGPRRFLICEFDSGTQDEQAALLVHLAHYLRLVCVVHSGGKSLHGWFYVQGEPEGTIKDFFRYAVNLGADRATWTRSQFVRMPDGTRDHHKRQTVFFLNFKPSNIFK